MNRRGSAMIQVLLVLTAAVVLSCAMLQAAAFSLHDTQRRIRKTQCEILAASVSKLLMEQGFLIEENLPETGEPCVYELETELLPGNITVECSCLEGEENSGGRMLRVTVKIQNGSGTATVCYTPQNESEMDQEEYEWE